MKKNRNFKWGEMNLSAKNNEKQNLDLKEELNEFVLWLEIILILLKLDSKLEQTIYFIILIMNWLLTIASNKYDTNWQYPTNILMNSNQNISKGFSNIKSYKLNNTSKLSL